MNTLSKKVDADLTNIFKSIEGTRTFENVATKHGTALERHAKSNVTAILKETHKSFKAFDTGMTTDFENPFLSVSPDLETSSDCCGCGNN